VLRVGRDGRMTPFGAVREAIRHPVESIGATGR
jgi:hypothetical protein